MARYKTRRMRRYLKLTDAGFVGWEARNLSLLPFSRVPYIKDLINGRKKEYEASIRKAAKKAWPEDQFNRWWGKHIKLRYIALGWKHKGDKWGATVAYRMLKAEKRRYEAKHRGYESPWVKKGRRFKDFIDRIDREYETKYHKQSSKMRGAKGDQWVG